jgi:hypothetical protein
VDATQTNGVQLVRPDSAVIVKVRTYTVGRSESQIYDENDDVKLNEMLEVVGILWTDPQGGQLPSDDDAYVDEFAPYCPPASLVPRVQAVFYSTLSHCNPHLPSVVPDERLCSLRDGVSLL